MCDIGIYYIPEPPEGRPFTHGTIVEMAWADAFNKPTILVTDSDHIKSHPVIGAVAGWIVDNFDDAVELCIGIIGAYTIGGKNV